MLAGLILLVAPSADAAKRDFVSCSSSRDGAREELAKAITAYIDSEYDERASAIDGKEAQQIRSTLNVKSQLELAAVRVEKKGENEYCASQSGERLEKTFQAALRFVLSACGAQDLKPVLEECRRKATTAKTLYLLFAEKISDRDLAKLNAFYGKIEDAAQRTLYQTLTFTLEGSGRYDPKKAVVLIDHLPRPLGAPIYVKAGTVKYTIEVPGYCPITGRVDVREGQPDRKVDRRVSRKLSDYTYPKVVFRTKANNARLYVEGKPASFSQTVIVDRCRGSLPYSLRAQDGQQVSGEIDLKPGLDTTENIVVSDLKSLEEVAKAWEDRHAVWVRYGGGAPLLGGIRPDWIQTVQVEYLAAYDPIRIGGGLLYGYGGTRDHQIDAYAKIIAQITRFGDYPAHIGSSLAFIPYLGVEAGLGYHGHRVNDAGTRGDFGSIAESIIVFRGVLGTAFTLNEVFSLIAEYNWAFITHERRMGVNIGLGFLF